MVRADLAAEDAFRILAPTLSERQEWMRLYVVYEVITDREEDVARKVANLLTMGEIAEMRMEEPLRGFECFGKAFVADPRTATPASVSSRWPLPTICGKTCPA